MFFKSFCASIFFAFLSLIFVSCDKLFSESNSVNARAVFSDIKLEPKNSSKSFSVLILTDLHASSQKFEYIATSTEKSLLPSQSEILFCAVLGDISTKAEASEYVEFQKFRQRLENCGIKVFSVIKFAFLQYFHYIINKDFATRSE